MFGELGMTVEDEARDEADAVGVSETVALSGHEKMNETKRLHIRAVSS